MDSGWAVVVGAIVAFAGTSVVPWIRERFERKATAARDRREALHAAIDAYMTMAAAVFPTIGDFPKELAALVPSALRLQLLLRTDELPISEMIDKANERMLGDDIALRSAAYTSLRYALSEWHAMGATPAQAADMWDFMFGMLEKREAKEAATREASE